MSTRIPESDFRSTRNRGEGGVNERRIKPEPGCRRRHGVESEQPETSESRNGVAGRRVLRSKYLALRNTIHDEREDILDANSDKFKSIFNEVENLHQMVTKPREQVADAEALLGIANTLVTSVKAQNSDGVTPNDFISCMLQKFGKQNGGQARTLGWKDVGLEVCHIFMKVPGCSTMVGPMDVEVKQRKIVTQRKRTRKPTTTERPEDLDDAEEEQTTDTDRNMITMYDILKNNKRVMLDNLLLNRVSFAQTVENLFALSFLVKDGRVKITVDSNGRHLVTPRNGPTPDQVASGVAAYNHFVLRLDFKDWQLMKDTVTVGEELMPHRTPANISSDTQGEVIGGNTQGDSQREVTGKSSHGARASTQKEVISESSEGATAGNPTTPIRKFSRNRGLIIQEDSVIEDSPENVNPNLSAAAIRKGKRKPR
ncbi:non-structural maintenance of chromosomes element 4 homolog A-like [Papaver somniferum]|uniref:non-structural maintenance of chromosomes element 4 homolog A-like n=1 Tax=Papaver somniferum TaxID=3469 RepID=UPI000E705A0C|nr:non-structural maintenance of chromosomes element 4 homolog A-like [Papaver somniferum]